MRTARHAEAGERVCHLEGCAGERALRLVADDLIAADPVFARVAAAHVGPPGLDLVAANGLLLERFPLGLPVGQRAGFEIEVQRPAVSIRRANGTVGCRGWCLTEQTGCK